MIKITVIGLEKFKNKINKLPANLKKELSQEVKFSAEQFRDQAISDAPYYLGDIVDKIKVNEKNSLSFEVVSGSKHSAPMEFGTKKKFKAIPGVDSSGFRGLPKGGTFKQFVRSLEKWVAKKGIAGTYSVKTRRRLGNKKTKQKQNRQIAYVIARSIVRNGVTPHPYFYKQIPSVSKDLLSRAKNIFKNALAKS